MRNVFSKLDLLKIAEECLEFEHVIGAMGYGYSLVNVSEEGYERRCDDCVHWLGGSCGIFQKEFGRLKLPAR